MLVTLLKAKLHHARVTESDRDYEGSLAIDEDLMDAAGILNHEKILVADVDNGNRFETYAIKGARGSKTIGLNGATTHLGSVGDRLIVFTFCQLTSEEAQTHVPTVVLLDENNQPT